MKRRDFLRQAAAAAVSAGAVSAAGPRALAQKTPSPQPKRYREWLAARAEQVIKRAAVDSFLSEAADSGQWARFDPELGYVLRDSIMRDGVDGSSTIARYSPTGERKLVNFADRTCRINTYGDSFTQCHQVSDGETWQEHLAAHLGEPIRNFGIGGYGVFQAYRRLRRVEQTAIKAPYLVLNIWGDDPQRSLMPCRALHIGWRRAGMFHGNPWTHLRVDLETGSY